MIYQVEHFIKHFPTCFNCCVEWSCYEDYEMNCHKCNSRLFDNLRNGGIYLVRFLGPHIRCTWNFGPNSIESLTCTVEHKRYDHDSKSQKEQFFTSRLPFDVPNERLLNILNKFISLS